MPDLPTGTVTLLFTDIVGSTRLVQEHADRYRTLLGESRASIRAAAHEYDGQEVEASGDRSLFVFRRARDAAAAALVAQRALQDCDWPDGAFGVAIGLHTGEPSPYEGGYVGPDVHRAWLVCAQAGPGQILASDATRQLIQDDVPEGGVLRTVGERMLGGLDRPERLHRLEIEGLSPAEPASRQPRGLPTGTLTLLFSDIESSTALLRTLGDRWPEAHAEHRRLLRAAFTRAMGREVDTQGDAFFAVFPRARDALEGAAAAQRSFFDHQWPDGAELRVRLGIHTGEPVVGEEGYLGLHVVRGARICSAAHGGQVLVSETTRALVRGDEPAGIELRDLGEHHLKDLEHPERLFQLVAPGLPADFPAPRSLDSRREVHAPVPALRVAERQRELAAGAMAAVRDLDRLGPAIERQVDDALRAAGVVTPPLRERRAVTTLTWILALVVVGAAAIWLALRIL